MDRGGVVPELSMHPVMYNEAEWNEWIVSRDEHIDVPRVVRFGVFEADLASG